MQYLKTRNTEKYRSIAKEDELRGCYVNKILIVLFKFYKRLQQEVFELRSKLDAKEKALVSQENEFEEYQKLITKKHEQDLEEMQETLKKELRAMKKEKDSSMAELVQVMLLIPCNNHKRLSEYILSI